MTYELIAKFAFWRYTPLLNKLKKNHCNNNNNNAVCAQDFVGASQASFFNRRFQKQSMGLPWGIVPSEKIKPQQGRNDCVSDMTFHWWNFERCHFISFAIYKMASFPILISPVKLKHCNFLLHKENWSGHNCAGWRVFSPDLRKRKWTSSSVASSVTAMNFKHRGIKCASIMAASMPTANKPSGRPTSSATRQ